MRGKADPFYRAAVGALAGFGLIGLMTVGGPFVLAGVVLALVGLPLLRTWGTWAFFVGFGGPPALVSLLNTPNGVRSASNPYRDQSRGPGATRHAGLGVVVVRSGQLLRRVRGGRALRVVLGILLRRTGRRAASA